MTVANIEHTLLARLFSASVFKEFAKTGKSPQFARLADELQLTSEVPASATVSEVFDLAFRKLRAKQVRNEYVYQAALVQNVLLGRHNLQTASLIAEMRAGKSKADIVILNGTATAYEIKSERDTLVRLSKQVADYQRVFAKVYVISSEDHCDGVASSVGAEVGLLCLTRWNRISTVREAFENWELIEPLAVLESLQTPEALEVLRLLDVAVPDVPNGRMRTELMSIFACLDSQELQGALVDTLKRSRTLAPLEPLLRELPVSLKPAAIKHKISKSQWTNLQLGISSTMFDAQSWV
ncbi:sce7726 family protein [Marivivens donghaensis]|uniref:Sce7726 family protein n=1 Tax=Marivivens donghaensis TaxID=1699413 RepID=A0ABX0VUT6_9RHOB|nr:sce7726 family protein [Marivivens donghaensis]NIY71828.1 sce7726 family protein [Marivivens donghaensis]